MKRTIGGSVRSITPTARDRYMLWERAGETKHCQTSAASGVFRGREGGALNLSHPIGPCSLHAFTLTQNPGALFFMREGMGIFRLNR